MIKREIRRLGIREGDIVVCHSALSAFGKVRGAATAVVDALLETIGPQGTLVMPTHSFESPYNFRKSPSAMGAISEEFRRRPGTVRSLNPILPASALGPKAKELVSNHHQCQSPYIGSPYDLAAKAGGSVLLLGVDQDRNTTIHCAEALAPAPYMLTAQARYVNERGRERTYKTELAAGPHRDFIGLDRRLQKAGIVKVGRVGDCVIRLMKGQPLIDFCMAEIRKDPTVFLTKNENYWDGVMQRGMVRAARLRQESFTLLMRTSSAGANLKEVFWQAAQAGVCALEVDVVDGRDLSELNEKDLTDLRRRVSERRMRVAVVRTNVLSDVAFARTLQAAVVLGAKTVIWPLTGSMNSLRQHGQRARRSRTNLLFENIQTPSDEVEQLMQALAHRAGLAFNPAHFAAVGEYPFRQSITRLKRYTRCVVFADASPLGVPCVPGHGYGELKEMISILRCSSYDGFISLGAAASARLPCGQVVDAFYNLLDAC